MNYYVEYVESGINKVSDNFNTYEEAEKWIEENQNNIETARVIEE